MSGELDRHPLRNIPPFQWGKLAAECWQRKMRGQTPDFIAGSMNLTARQVRKMISDHVKNNPPPDLEEHRALHLDQIALQRRRLESVLAEASRTGTVVITEQGFEVVAGKDLELMRKVIMDLAKLEEREAKFIGIDAPERSEVEVTVKTEEQRKMEKLFERIEMEAEQ